MSNADIALISYGTTAYELATLGIQAFYFCLSQDHADSAKEFEKNFYGKSFGYSENIDKKILLSNFIEYMNSLNKGLGPLEDNKKNKIGSGAKNIAEVINKNISQGNK